MIIDFNKISLEEIMGFKGGEGLLRTQNFTDGKAKIMMSRLTPGAHIGYHAHEANCEIILVLQGMGHFRFDNTEEQVCAGSVHYCPMGHSHAFYNDGDTDLVYFAIVPEHHVS